MADQTTVRDLLAALKQEIDSGENVSNEDLALFVVTAQVLIERRLVAVLKAVKNLLRELESEGGDA